MSKLISLVIYVLLYTRSSHAQPSFAVSYYTNAGNTGMLFCGPKVLTGDWLLDAKALGSYAISATVSIFSTPGCYLVGDNLSSTFTTDCTGPSIRAQQYSSSSCTGEIVQSVTYSNGATCEIDTSSIMSDDAQMDDAQKYEPTMGVATVSCTSNYPAQSSFSGAVLLTGFGADIQLVNSFTECATKPILSSTFSGYQNLVTAVFIYSNGCYRHDQGLFTNASISGTMDCETGVMNFWRYEEADCMGPAFNITGTCSSRLVDDERQIFTGFCLGNLSSPSTSSPISLGILIGVPLGGGIALITGVLCFFRWRKYGSSGMG